MKRQLGAKIEIVDARRVKGGFAYVIDFRQMRR